MTEDEMVGWHHQLNGHKSEQTLRDNDGQGSLVCCSSWGRKEMDTTYRLNNNAQTTPFFRENPPASGITTVLLSETTHTNTGIPQQVRILIRMNTKLVSTHLREKKKLT